VGWLGFLLLDVVAAVRERGSTHALTLSRNVWKWFDTGWKRSVLAAFLAAVGAHLVYEASPWWLLSAVPVVAVIVDAVWWAGEMSLIDRALRSLGTRWLRGKVDNARKGGSAVLKLMDGNKRLLVVLGFIVSGLVALVTGQDVSAWLDVILRATGWTNPEMIEGAKGLATQIVPMLFAIWAAAHALWKMRAQWKAGATASELNGPVGVVKAAVADGTLASATKTPVVLTMTDKASTPAKVEPVVARVVAEPTPSPAPKLSPLPVR